MSNTKQPYQAPYAAPSETSVSRPMARMEPLAVLPVFWKLQDKRVLLVGAGEGAAWKAELLAAAGAHVDVIAEELEEEMEELLTRGSEAGTFTHYARKWSINDFNLAAMALADIENDAEAHAFYCAAKAAKVPVNLIDNPKYCDFQFGTIVNRSPVVVGVSTDGAAPILGQAIRRRIEALLPRAMAQTAALVKPFRDRLKELVPHKPSRRAFWEGFADRAFEQRPLVRTDLENMATQTAAKDKDLGSVTLVGAGPGDAGLITLKGVRALQAADIILFDNLVGDEILELGRRESRRILVGKRGGMKSCKQEEINEMMVDLAKKGNRVVRLKGGDPMVFGRAGEEITDLMNAGIPTEVVPGITAASGAAASLGVSLTHRDHAQSVRFVTGHAKDGKIPENLHWQGMASGDTTLIFYMSSRTGHEVSDNLIKYGMKADTPVIIVANVSRENQRVWKGELKDLAVGIEETAHKDPIIIGIGTVFTMYNERQARKLATTLAKG